jgi:hypothetical protein
MSESLLDFSDHEFTKEQCCCSYAYYDEISKERKPNGLGKAMDIEKKESWDGYFSCK